MSLTSALFIGLSGLNANSQAINVSGNNIANSNTTAYKASRIDFETSISQTLQPASAPSAELGGSNPVQVGLGVRVGAVTKNFNSGSVSPTGRATDMAIEGNGFFQVNRDSGTYFTRAGNFALDRDFNLVSPGGGRVQGFGVDSKFNVIENQLVDVNIPIGSLTLAEKTSAVQFGGNLNTAGDLATQGAVIETAPIFDPNQPSGFVDSTSLLTDLQDSTGNPLFLTGDVITVSDALKGGATLPTKTFEVGATNTTGADAAGTTLADYMTFLDELLGLDSAADAGAGVTIDTNTGVLTIQGNSGEVNDIDLEATNIVKNIDTVPESPFQLSKTQAADGESVRTTFVAFDSLGSPVTIDLSLVLESKSSAGAVWRFYAQSEADSDLDRVLGTGTLSFDTNGQLTTVVGGSVAIDRQGTGAQSPQTIRLDFSNPDTGAGISALADVASQVTALSQDGSPIGTLQQFTIGQDGSITGVFSNGLLRTLGKVTLAAFANPQGLTEIGQNEFIPTGNSGLASIVSAGSSGAGRIIGQALELSNVDLSSEFIALITASTGFSASSRVLSTSDQLMQELLSVVR